MEKTFQIATWNVNSLRVRLQHVLQWLAFAKPDVLALQELKMPDEDFPHEAFKEIGYGAIVNGQKTWNGVAILSRDISSEVISTFPHFSDPQKRLLAITLNQFRIINVYIPNGESVTSEKFKYKLNWLEHFKLFLQTEKEKYSKIIVLGDFNIAPHNEDVYDPTRADGQVLFSAPERAVFDELIKMEFRDCFRLHPQPEKSFSWWDYRLNAFKRNLGFRIDHILATSQLANHCTKCFIDKTPRAWERPSDHTPVVAMFRY